MKNKVRLFYSATTILVIGLILSFFKQTDSMGGAVGVISGICWFIVLALGLYLLTNDRKELKKNKRIYRATLIITILDIIVPIVVIVSVAASSSFGY